jgi:alanine racemase
VIRAPGTAHVPIFQSRRGKQAEARMTGQTTDAAVLDALARPNRFEIDLGAIHRSARAIRERVGPAVKVFATLKSNGYGYGLLPVARTVRHAGVDGISLVSLPDAIRLREAGFDCPILLYAGSPFEPHVVDAIERHALIPTLHDEASFAALAAHARGPLDVAVKFDAGNERIGVHADVAGDFLVRVAATGKLRIAVVNTHPYLRDGPAVQAHLAWQHGRFVRACAEAEARGVRIPLKVLASSKVLRMTREMNLDGVDPGQAFFSGPPDMTATEADDFQPFVALRSRLMKVRTVDRGAFLAEAPFPVHPGMRLGVVPIGYSDGVDRLNAGCVLVRGRRMPLLGSPSLEYTRIDLTDAPDAVPGDDVVFIGAQGDARIRPEEVLAVTKLGRVPDLAMQVRPGIPRLYLDAIPE